MRLTLGVLNQDRVTVDCDGRYSHEFSLSALRNAMAKEANRAIPGSASPLSLALHAALFSSGVTYKRLLAENPRRLLIATDDERLNEPPWERACGRDGRPLCLLASVVRIESTATPDRQPLLTAHHTVVAVPAAPLVDVLGGLDVVGEYGQLVESITALQADLTIVRSRPATIDCVAKLARLHAPVILHFMGHGQDRNGSSGVCLHFEKEDGSLCEVDSHTLARA